MRRAISTNCWNNWYGARSESGKSCWMFLRLPAIRFRAGLDRDKLTVMRVYWLPLFAVSIMLAGSTYTNDITEWRTKHEAGLKTANGWLTVAGLFWLHEG